MQKSAKNNMKKKSKKPKRKLGKKKLVRVLDRKVSVPVAYSTVTNNRGPVFKSAGRNGDIRVIHREYIADIKANTGTPSTYQCTAYAINPGLPATFPWLSKLAINYESYKFNSLKFDYKTEASSSLGGAMALTVDYDAADALPTSKPQIMAYRGVVRSAPWNDCRYIALSEDLHKQKSNYVREDSLASNLDIHTYDIGNLLIATQGVATASAVMGEIYVDYDITLMTPTAKDPLTFGGTIYNPTGTGADYKDPFFGSVFYPGSYGIEEKGSILRFLEAGQYLLNLFGNWNHQASFNYGVGGGAAASEVIANAEALGGGFYKVAQILIITITAASAATAYVSLVLPSSVTVITSVGMAIARLPKDTGTNIAALLGGKQDKENKKESVRHLEPMSPWSKVSN